MTSDFSVPELVAFALFDLDPHVDAAQRPLHSFLVSLALLNAPDGLIDGDVHNRTLALLPLDPSSISPDHIGAAIELHLNLNLVTRGPDGRIRLTDERRGQLENARERIEAEKRAFHSHMVTAVVATEPNLSAQQQAALLQLLENQLVALLQEQCSIVAAAWAQGGQGFDAGIPDLNAREHVIEIANAVAPGGAQPNKLQRIAIALGLENGLRTVSNDAAAYLGALYQRTIAMALLQQDPSLRRVKSTLAAQRVAYLDSNVVISVMFESDAEHDLAHRVLDVTRSLGAELRVTGFTISELERKISDASRWMTKYDGPDQLREVINDVIVRSYHRATRETENLKWAAFVGSFYPPHAWLRENGIAIDDDDAETKGDTRVDRVRTELSRNRRTANSGVLETDALNIIHVTRWRRYLPADEMGNRVWLVTLDRSLAKGEKSLVDSSVLPGAVSRLATNWVDLLSPCLPPGEDRLAGYAAHLVQSQFSLLAEDPLFVEKQFLLTLARSRFGVAEILDMGTERARQILVRLQADQELEELMGSPRVEDDDWNEALGAAVRKALADLETSARAQAELDLQRRERDESQRRAAAEHQGRLDAIRALAEARDAAKVLHAENSEVARERDDVQGRLDAAMSASWWRRLFRRY